MTESSAQILSSADLDDRTGDLRDDDPTVGELQLSERASLQRVAGLSTELTDVTEVEYRQLRLEKVVLVGVWTEGSAASAEANMAELAALAETAGSQVLDARGQDAGELRIGIPGGEVTVTIRPDGSTLRGPSMLVADGVLRPGWDR